MSHSVPPAEGPKYFVSPEFLAVHFGGEPALWGQLALKLGLAPVVTYDGVGYFDSEQSDQLVMEFIEYQRWRRRRVPERNGHHPPAAQPTEDITE